MGRPLKLILLGLTVLMAIFFALIAFVAATFNPNDYKATVTQLVLEKKQRNLHIPGTIRLQFFPKIGVDLGRISLSERNSGQEFLAIEQASVSLAIWPLLKKELVVDKIKLQGLRANIVREKDGKMNFDDLLAKDEKSDDKFRFDIDGISIKKAQVVIQDRATKQRFELSELELESGPIANARSSKLKLQTRLLSQAPELVLDIKLDTGFTIDLPQAHYALKNLQLELDGKAAQFSKLALKTNGDMKITATQTSISDLNIAVQAQSAQQAMAVKFTLPKVELGETEVQSEKMTGSATLSQGKDKLEVALNVAAFRGSRKGVSVPQFEMQLDLLRDQLQAKGKLTSELVADFDRMLVQSKLLKLQMEGGSNTLLANMSSPMLLNLAQGTLELPKLHLQLKLPHPAGKASGTLNMLSDGHLKLDWQKQQLASAFKGSLDESNFDAKLGVKNFSAASYQLDLVLDKMDVDRYRPRAVAANEAAKNNTAPVDTPLDLHALATLRANAKVQVGSLKFANLQLNNVKLDLHAQPGKIEVAPLSAVLYGGNLQGSLALLLGKTQQFVVKQNLNGIQIGPLLADAIKKKPLEGRGNVVLDIKTEGSTMAQWKKALSGSAKLSLQDGAVSGFNLAQIIRQGKSMMGSSEQQSGTASAQDKTDFSELSASFKLASGIAHNDDLSVKSPLFRVAGVGDINLGEDKLDYLLKPTVVSSLQGQGGPELQALKGLTIPVRLSGPFTAIGWKIDFASMAKEAAAQKVNEKKEEVKTKLQDRIKEGLKGLFGK